MSHSGHTGHAGHVSALAPSPATMLMPPGSMGGMGGMGNMSGMGHTNGSGHTNDTSSMTGMGNMSNMSDMSNTSGMGSMSPMTMQMSFYWGPNVTLLFSSWTVDSWGAYMGSLLVCLLLALSYEGVTAFRLTYMSRLKERIRKEQEEHALCEADTNGTSKSKVPVLLKGGAIVDRFLSAALMGISAALSYLLMLMIMSFNVGVFIAVVLGHSIGMLVFGGVHMLAIHSFLGDSCRQDC